MAAGVTLCLSLPSCVPIQPGETSTVGAGDDPENRKAAATLSSPPTAGQREIADNKIECDKLRGNYSRQGLAGNYMCILTFSDAGKQCSSASQCFGECIVRGNGYPKPQQMPIGQCKSDNSPFGCYATIDENGAARPLLCRD